MGSSQSTSTVETPIINTDPKDTVPVNQQSLPQNTTENTANQTEQVKTKKAKRTGIDAVNYKCRKKKASYDKCVSQWYNERFLQGKSVNQEEECGDFFESYRQCYMKAIKREFFDKGQKKPKEGSILAEELDD